MNKYFLACILVSYNAITFCYKTKGRTKFIPSSTQTIQCNQSIIPAEFVPYLELAAKSALALTIHYAILASAEYFKAQNSSQQ